MKTRTSLCIFCTLFVGSASVFSAGQASQSTGTNPTPQTQTSSAGISGAADTNIQGNNVTSPNGSAQSLPPPPPLVGNDDSSNIGNGSSLLANMGPIAPMHYQSPTAQSLHEDLSKAVDAVNHDLRLIHRQRVGLDVYNDLITSNRAALRDSLALAKFLAANPTHDPKEDDHLTHTVTQLEAVQKYVISVRHVLATL